VKLITFIAILCLCQASWAQEKRAPKNDVVSGLKIPTEPVSPSGFDFGKMTEQGNLNEYRIGQLETDLKKVKETIDTVKGAWWAVCGAFVILLTVVSLNVRFLGKHIAFALVEHYREKMPPTPPAADTARA